MHNTCEEIAFGSSVLITIDSFIIVSQGFWLTVRDKFSKEHCLIDASELSVKHGLKLSRIKHSALSQKQPPRGFAYNTFFLKISKIFWKISVKMFIQMNPLTDIFWGFC